MKNKFDKGFGMVPMIVLLAVFGLVIAGVAYFSSSTQLPSEAKRRHMRFNNNMSQGNVRQPAENQAQAKNAMLSLSTGSQQVSGEGSKIPVTVSFGAGGEAVSAVVLRLLFEIPGGASANATDVKISPALLSGGSWVCPIRLTGVENGKVMVDLACINTSPTGFMASSSTPMATFDLNLNNGQFTTPLVMKVNDDLSAITRKVDGKNILGTIGQISAN